MKHISILAIALSICSGNVFADAYSQGLSSGSSSIQMLINAFVNGKNLSATTGADANASMNSTSQSAADTEVLKGYLAGANAANAPASASLNGPGGRGEQKKIYCLNYTDKTKTPNPDPVKYAECVAVNELNKTPVKDYRARTGFSKSNAIFSNSSAVAQARKAISDAPQSELLGVVGMGTSPNGASGQNCTTITRTGAADVSKAQCSRAAVPDSTPCQQTVTPRVLLEKFCNAFGTGAVTTTLRSHQKVDTDPALAPDFGDLVIAETHTDRYSVSYRCGPPDLSGEVSTLYAQITPTMPVPNGFASWGGAGCPFSLRPYDLLITPGVSTATPVTTQLTCTGRCNGLGCWWGDYQTYNTATIWYDGPTDTVNISDNFLLNESGGGYMTSCKTGSTFVQASGTWTETMCSCTGMPGCSCSGKNKNGNFITVSRYASPSHCATAGKVSLEVKTPVVTTTTGTWIESFNNQGNSVFTLVCPTGYIPYSGIYDPAKTTCYKATYASCSAIAPDTWVINTPPATYNAGVPVFPSQYCTRQSAINDLRMYAPAPHYSGGAGVRTVLAEEVADTCASLQNQSPAGPAANGGSYPPVSKLIDSCPAGYELVTAAPPAPAYCRMQPASQPAIQTITYLCPNGGTPNPAANNQCEYQAASYTAILSRLYTCPGVDKVTNATCPNGGTKIGETCKYPPYRATVTSETCPSGYSLVGNLCYNNPSLSSTVFMANGTTVLDSTKVYACQRNDVLNGYYCEYAPQAVTCQYQPPYVASYPVDHYNCPATVSGAYTVTYVQGPDNTVQSNFCTANQLTKASNLVSRVCPTNYTWVAGNGRCEYQRPDYAAY